MLNQYLDDLERRIDTNVEEQLFQEWMQFLDGKRADAIFSPRRPQCAEAGIQWPDININDALDDYELMALQQLTTCSNMLAQGTGDILAVRCNYGTGILPSLFGAELFIMPRETNTLPTNRPVEGGADAMKALLDRGVPDVHNGLGGKVFEMAERFQEMMRPYPTMQRHVHLYHPDTQGPMDVCELLWGSSLFVALMDVPDLVKDVLDMITQTYISFMTAWAERVPFDEAYNVHWSLLHKGNIMLRDDSAMNLSLNMFKEFIEPYDQRLLDAFGGGAIHFCGKGDHYIPRIPAMPGVYAVQMSQPEYNDMEKIFANTVDKGIPLLNLQRDAAEQALQQGRDLHGRVHCAWQGGLFAETAQDA